MRKLGMKRMIALLSTTLGAAVLAVVPISLHWSPTKTLSLSLDAANARIGNPLSPGSIAGVNRRVNRRAARRGYYGGGVYGAGVVGAGVVGAVAARAAYGSTPYYGGNFGSNSYYGGGYRNLYNYSPGVYATGQNTAADTHPLALDAIQYEYCRSRTFNAGPC